MAEYISIKEFAERAGVSTQAIYQRTARDLQAHCKEIDGKKMINTEALQLFSKETQQEACKETANDLQGVLMETITALREQLAVKDKQIEALTAALMNAQQSEQQAHALHAGTMQQAIETRVETAAKAAEPERRKGGWKFWQR